MRIALLGALLASATAMAQSVPPIPVNTEALVARVETSASAYAYGETIEARFTLSNPTDALAVIAGSGSCIVQFVLDDFESASNTACTAQDIGIPIPPRGALTWVWRLDPRDLGLPTRSGTHRLIGYHSGSRRDTTTFETPEYLGGTLSFGTVAGVTSADLAALRDSLQAEVLYEDTSSSPGVTGQWRIAGVSVDSVAARLGADSRFRYAEAARTVSYADVLTTSGEPVPPPVPDLRAYPNPASGTVTIDLGAVGLVSVEVVDGLGRRVLETTAAGSVLRIDTRAMAPGVYVVRIVGSPSAARFTVAR